MQIPISNHILYIPIIPSINIHKHIESSLQFQNQHTIPNLTITITLRQRHMSPKDPGNTLAASDKMSPNMFLPERCPTMAMMVMEVRGPKTCEELTPPFGLHRNHRKGTPKNDVKSEWSLELLKSKTCKRSKGHSKLAQTLCYLHLYMAKWKPGPPWKEQKIDQLTGSVPVATTSKKDGFWITCMQALSMYLTPQVGSFDQHWSPMDRFGWGFLFPNSPRFVMSVVMFFLL